MARISWSFYALLVLGSTWAVATGQRKNIAKIPLLVPVDDEFEQVKGLYVKDKDNGELRFLANNANFQTALNNFITQQQDFLEQLRPSSSSSSVPAISLNGNTITGLTSSTGTPSTTGTNGVTPVVVSLAGANTGTSSLTTSAVQALLPQIVANILQNQNTANRLSNRRRPNGNRRRPTVAVIRPQV